MKAELDVPVEIEHVVSESGKNAPLITTSEPVGPLATCPILSVSESWMNGPCTTNTPNRVAPLVAVMVTWYGPGATLLTMKLPVIAPPAVSEQPTKVTGDPSIEQVPAVPGLGSEACTPTVPPMGAASGVKVTGEELPTMRVAEAESWELPVTVIV